MGAKAVHMNCCVVPLNVCPVRSSGANPEEKRNMGCVCKCLIPNHIALIMYIEKLLDVYQDVVAEVISSSY